MSYLIYNVSTTRIYSVNKPGHLYGKTSYASERLAKAALTREVNKGRIIREEYAITDSDNYADNIEKMETVSFVNPHSGERSTITQSVNTPRSCDPSSELYWTM